MPSLAQVASDSVRSRPYGSLRRVDCTLADDVLILTGSVETYYLKQTAQEAVSKLEGIREIKNLIVVRAR